MKLRAGLVRCGYCKEIFNGIENLLPSEGAAMPAAPATTKAVATPQTPATPVVPHSEADTDGNAGVIAEDTVDTLSLIHI